MSKTPLDNLNGVRVGIVVGALLGTGAVVLTGFISVWPILGGAMGGGVIGFWWQRRELN